jgi:hypothetical protein
MITFVQLLILEEEARVPRSLKIFKFPTLYATKNVSTGHGIHGQVYVLHCSWLPVRL